MSSVQEGCIHLAERAYKVTVVAISYRDSPCIYTLAAATRDAHELGVYLPGDP